MSQNSYVTLPTKQQALIVKVHISLTTLQNTIVHKHTEITFHALIDQAFSFLYTEQVSIP